MNPSDVKAALMPGAVVLLAICFGYVLGYRRGTEAQKPGWDSRQMNRVEESARNALGSADRGDAIHPQIFCANPDYYDYIHHLELRSNGSVRLVAGAGQALHFEANGNYMLDLPNGKLELFNLQEINPYSEKVPRNLPNRTNAFRTERGPFAMLQEIPYRPKTPEEAPVIIFRERYVFESDPLGFAHDNARSNLYYITETRDLIDSERIYYRSDLRERIAVSEAKRLGLTLLSKADQIVEMKNRKRQ